MTEASDQLCTYGVGLADDSRECEKRALWMVLWPKRLSPKGTMYYCSQHYQAVRHMLELADEVNDLMSDER